MLQRLFLFILFFIETRAFGHPVIFKDGIMMSSSNMSSYSDNQIMYSLSHKFALGINHWRFTTDDGINEYGFLKLNYLLKRFHLNNAQANIYLHGGVGALFSEIESVETELSSMVGIETDWETRTLFTAFKYYYFNSSSYDDISMIQARIGFSPFESGFDELQSWFMLQLMAMPNTSVPDKIIVTPLMRFFFKNILWEVGSSTRGEWMINLMVHY